MKDKSLYELATRINQIEVEITNLQLEYNKIVKEIKTRLPELENDVNLKEKVKKNEV